MTCHLNHKTTEISTSPFYKTHLQDYLVVRTIVIHCTIVYFFMTHAHMINLTETDNHSKGTTIIQE